MTDMYKLISSSLLGIRPDSARILRMRKLRHRAVQQYAQAQQLVHRAGGTKPASWWPSPRGRWCTERWSNLREAMVQRRLGIGEGGEGGAQNQWWEPRAEASCCRRSTIFCIWISVLVDLTASTLNKNKFRSSVTRMWPSRHRYSGPFRFCSELEALEVYKVDTSPGSKRLTPEHLTEYKWPSTSEKQTSSKKPGSWETDQK